MNNRSPKRPATTLLLIILTVLLLGVNARKGIHPSPHPEAGSCQADSDGDAVCESADNCPLVANAGQQDQDADGVGDVCDACPTSSGAPEDACLGPGTWETRPGNSVARAEAGLVEVGGSLYLIAGENTASVEIYNVATRTWTAGVSLPTARNHIQAVTVNGKIYVLGGLAQFPGPSLNQNLMFDPQNPLQGWQTRAPLPTSRGALGCAADGIKIYCAGGLSSTAGNTAINVMEVYDTVANSWATLAPMPRDRDHFQAEIIKGKFYAVSGRDTTISAKLAFNDIYDIATNTWSQGALIPTPRGGYASEVIQGRLLIIGGEGGGPSNGTFPNVEEYDPRRNSWRALANIPTPRHGISGAISTVETGNPKDARLYVISGGPSEGGSNSTVNQVFYFRFACSVNADCNDGNPCTTDTCVTGTCQRTNNTASCNDGVACTSADVCSGGFCAGTSNCTGGQVCNLGTGQCGPPGPAVTSFTLINADSDLPIASFDPLPGGAVLNLATLPTQNLNVRANTSPATASVVFGLDGATFRIESGAPYALAGDVSGNYNAWTPSLGPHTLTGTAWSSAGGTGTPGSPLTIDFTVVNQGTLPNQLGVAPASVDFGQVAIGTSASRLMTLTNLGGAGSPSITVSNVTVGGNFSENISPPIALAPGASTTFNLTFLPPTVGLKTSTLQVTHSGTNSPVSVSVQGTGFDPAAQPISFNKSVLQGTSISSPTTLQFGPDGHLYVGQQNGTISIFTIVRNGPTNYAVTATQTLSLVKNIPNHNDNGNLNTSVTNRQLTGLLVTGTPSNPILYATSSDPRIGGDTGGTDTGLDTNSGVVSRLTWNGTSWVKLDLVRGLPRSEENHSANGLQLDSAANKLYVTQGGNTNMGAPSNNFALLPEYALSTAILSIDLTAIGNTTYDLPTLDDPARPGTNDANDPFGGNDAANQAKLVPGGPVQVHSPGFRNPYDLVITSLGRMYTIDNGPNAGWGDVPTGEGTSTCTNAVKEPGITQGDGLHFITGPGYYGGHPNPTRANPGNTFNGQSPVSVPNAVECDYRAPGPANGSLAVWGSSTNGLTEYTASNFGGMMQGDLLATSFNNTLQRIKLNAAGTATTLVQALFSNVGANPLDVTAQGNSQVFPGTIWVANHGNGTITVYDPVDFLACTGADNPALDEDHDGYDNADEIDNGTSPCSAGDIPPDRDGDFTSDLNDPDDDNDTLPDVSDPFAIDPANGTTTNLPVNYTWDNNAPNPGGLVNLGFTGLMTNGTSNYESLFDPDNMTAGGAAGVATVDLVPEGDALGGINTQQYGFQFGINVSATSGVFTAHTRIQAPFAGLTPQDFQSMGLFLGSGTQNDYAKLVVSANGGSGGIQFGVEVSGAFTARPTAAVPLPGPSAIDLYLTVDPAAGTVQPIYSVTSGGVTGTLTALGGPAPIPATWLDGPFGLAVGILSTSRGSAPAFPATWDFIKVNSGPAGECAADADCNDGNVCTQDTCSAQVCQHSPNTNPCDDGIACTSGDTCSGSVCQPGFPSDLACNDSNPCTQDTCVIPGGCQHSNNTASCNDGKACTSGDVCSGGVCAGVVNCPAGQICSPSTGLCVPAGPAVVSLTLINADTNLPIAAFDPLTSGASLNLAALPTRNLNIRANTSPATVGSVQFGLDGNSNFRTESGAPYALAGDVSGNYNNWTPSVGSHTLTATPFSGPGATGTAGIPLSISFSVSDNPVGQVLVSFTLINADTDQPIAAFNPLTSGTTLNLATLPSRNINIRANTSPATVGSVVFGLDGNAAFRTESGAPYALAGDSNGNYAPWNWTLGPHTLTGTPYTGSGGTGTAGTPLTITLTLIDVP